MKKTIIAKILLIFTITIVIILGASNYLLFQSNKQLITDINKDNMADISNTLNAIEANILKEDRERVQTHIETIARYSSEYMQNFDEKGLRNIIRSDVKKEGIKLIQIWDNDLGDAFLMYLIKNDEIIFVTKTPKEFEKFEKFKAPINSTHMNTKRKLGEIIAYHDETHSMENILVVKEKSKQKIISLNIKANDRLHTFAMNSLVIYLISSIFSLIFIAIFLRKLINTPLRKLRAGFNDFFLFLARRRNRIEIIDIHSNDEFEEMADFLNDSMAISAKSFKKNNKLHYDLKIKSQEEKVLLDNTSQGFLTFDKNFTIGSEYSIKCEKMLGSNIAHNNILNILFSNDTESIDTSKKILLDALSIDSKIAQKSILTLLPKSTVLNKMYLALEYKIVVDNKFMLIITNKSQQIKLEARIKEEQDISTMIVAVIKDSDIFNSVKKDFKYFIANKHSYVNSQKKPLDNFNDLYRLIHTFKGTFLQLFMYDTVDKLHQVESQLSSCLTHTSIKTNEEIHSFLNGIDFNSFMDNDLGHIIELLGKEFVDNDNFIFVDSNIITDIKNQYVNLLESSSIENKLSKEILDNIMVLLQRPLIFQLDSYPKLIVNLAQKLGKEIYDFDVIGNRDIIVPEDFKPFIQSLAHVFRNSADHGIETAETRIDLGKDNIGTIACSFDVVNDNLQIIISDDGGGIDIETIKTKIPKEVDISKLSNADIHQYIFQEHISTKQEVSTISGRGIGMNAVKNEIGKLNGTIEIQSEVNVGTTFIFNVPLKKKEE